MGVFGQKIKKKTSLNWKYLVQFWKVVVTCRCQKLPIKKSCNAKVFWKVMNWVSKIGFSRTRNQPKNGILVQSKWLFFIFGMFMIIQSFAMLSFTFKNHEKWRKTPFNLQTQFFHNTCHFQKNRRLEPGFVFLCQII